MHRIKSRTEALRSIPLFRDLEEQDLRDIADLLIERKFLKDSTIFEENVPGDYMYLIQEGQVKVTKMSDDGREKILDFLSEGDFVGEMALVESAPRTASVKTTRPTVLLALSRHDFLSLLRGNADISLEVMRSLSRRLRETNEQIRGLLFDRVEGRTRRILSRYAKESNATHPDRLATQPMTHQQLADLVGTSRETITRVIKELKDSGWLIQDGKRYLTPKDSI